MVDGQTGQSLRLALVVIQMEKMGFNLIQEPVHSPAPIMEEMYVYLAKLV